MKFNVKVSWSWSKFLTSLFIVAGLIGVWLNTHNIWALVWTVIAATNIRIRSKETGEEV